MKKNRKEIRNFLLVLGSAVLLAIILVFWMVRVEGYDRGIYVREVLLSPQTMEVMSNRAVRVGGKEYVRYLVESVDYSFYDVQNSKWDMKTIDIGPYHALWNLIEGDRGSIQVDEAEKKLFDDSRVSTIAIYVRKEMPYQKEGLNELFQQIQFPSKGDWYRIQMHDESDATEWTYFYHPGIQAEVAKALKKQ